MKLLIINGPNLNMLGKRNPAIYGTLTLAELSSAVADYASKSGIDTDFFSTNSEAEIIDKMQSNDADGIILNAGALSHYSYSIRDCIECISVPVVEVHLSDITLREDFRRIRVFDGVVSACFFGEKDKSYFKAVDYFATVFASKSI